MVKPQLNGRLLDLFLKGPYHLSSQNFALFYPNDRLHTTKPVKISICTKRTWCQWFNGAKICSPLNIPGMKDRPYQRSFRVVVKPCHRRPIGPALPTWSIKMYFWSLFTSGRAVYLAKSGSTVKARNLLAPPPGFARDALISIQCDFSIWYLLYRSGCLIPPFLPASES